MKKINPVIIALLTTLTGYGAQAANMPPDSKTATPTHDDAGTQAANPGFMSGKIIETMNSGGYTYVLLDTGSGEIWAATKLRSSQRKFILIHGTALDPY